MEDCLLGTKTNGFIVLTHRYKEAGFSVNLSISESSLTTLQLREIILFLFYY